MKIAIAYPIRVAFVGDSITELTEYPYYASELLGSNYVVRNFGVCGSKVLLNSDNPYLYSPAFNAIIKFQPNIVIIMLGTNDADLSLEQQRGNFINDYLTLIQRFEALESKPQIWVVQPPPIFNDLLGLSVAAFEGEILPCFEKVANRTNLPVIDVHSVLSTPAYFVDGVHPNFSGAKIIADMVFNAIISNHPSIQSLR